MFVNVVIMRQQQEIIKHLETNKHKIKYVFNQSTININNGLNNESNPKIIIVLYVKKIKNEV